MNKINFKQLKYMIPAGIFPFLLFLGYQGTKLLNGEMEVETKTAVETSEVNTSLPTVDVDKKGIKSKYQSMLDNYGKVTDRTGVVNIEKEEEEKEPQIQSAYSEREKHFIDSINEARTAEQERLKKELQKLQDLSEGKTDEARVNTPDERIEDNSHIKQLNDQMMLIQKVMNGERILTEEEKKQLEEKKKYEALRAEILDSINRTEAPLEVNKASDANEQFFNSIKDGSERPGMIRARVDEVLKVKDGSRIRIRLSEDVEIDGDILPRGSCLYALVEGFSAQRVKAKVSQVMVNGHIRKVDLKVYDVDCIEGFYVPNNSFRELAKEIGAGAATGTNINMNTDGGEQSLQSVGMQMLQQAFQTTTQALGQQIKKNKAKIKFNTEIYLVNDKDILN